jgi:AraC family transcriptional activator of pobA
MKPELTSLKKFKDILVFMNLPVFSYIDSDDFAIIKIHDMGLKMPYLTPIFRPSYYTLTILQGGKGTFVVGDHIYELGPQHVFIKQPDVYFSSGWTESPVGYSISFTRAFFKKYCPNGIDDIPFKNNTNAINYCLNDTDFSKLEKICDEIYDEAISVSNYRYEMISNLLINILLLIKQHQHKSKLKIQDEKNAAIVASFFKNIDHNFNMLISNKSTDVLRVKEHANLLNLTETYLSKVISKTSGKTINQWINDRLIDEINYLLKNTNKPIPEIAEMFAFSDLKYFYTFFKKNTKSSPSSVRKDFNASDSDRAHVYRGDVVNIRPTW